MAHYAFLDENNIVTEVIVGKDETELIDGLTPEQWYANYRQQPCIRTSYNTQGGVHTSGGTPLRKNYAGIGYTYDPERDAFISPKDFPSWVLNEETCQWEAPVTRPEGPHLWNEETLSWVPING